MALSAYAVAILTDTTCGEACWHAKEEICRCSCGGANHGILKSADGEQPTRTCRIDGYRYELIAVGTGKEMRNQIDALLKDIPPHTVNPVKGHIYENGMQKEIIVEYKYYWRGTDAGSPYRLKFATPIQANHWKELSSYANLSNFDFKVEICPAMIWKRID